MNFKSQDTVLFCSVPVKGSTAEVDWNFLERIYENRDLRPYPVPEEERVGFTFEAAKYHDAVIMPWYRNQDQPQVSLFTSYCNRGRQHLVVWRPTKPLTSRLLVCQNRLGRDRDKRFKNRDIQP